MLGAGPASPVGAQGTPPQGPFPLYQMVQRCLSRFPCRVLCFFSMFSSSFFTAGGSWILSLAMNSLGIQTH